MIFLNSKTDESQPLQEWNRLLVEVLFPEGVKGTSRLFLTTEHITHLTERTKLTEKEVISALYRAASAHEIAKNLEVHVNEYKRTLVTLPEEVTRINKGKPLEQADFQQRLSDMEVKIIPPFLVHLAVIVHAYMSGEREDINPIDVYQTIAKNIAEVLNRTESLERIYDDLRQDWQQATSKKEYFIGSFFSGSGNDRLKLGEYSPWGILKRWIGLRAESFVGGAVVLDTCEVEYGPHGSVRPIRYNAPFLSYDHKVLEEIGKELRWESNVKPSSWSMLQHIQKEKHRLSVRARTTIDSAFEKQDEGAACFVDFVDVGFKSGEEPESRKSLESPKITAVPTVTGQNTARLEVTVRPDYYGELLKMNVRIIDTHDIEDDFVITINDKKITIPVDKLDRTHSEPLEEHLPEGLLELDLNSFHKHDLHRGAYKLQIQSTSAFLRTLQSRYGVWEESVPSSGQKILVISNEVSAKTYVKNEKILVISNEVSAKTHVKNEMTRDADTMNIVSPFKIAGKDICGIKGYWPIQKAISDTATFTLKGGIKSSGGRNCYLIDAPPMIVYSGSRAPQDFTVTQVINTGGSDITQKVLIYIDGCWSLEPTDKPCNVLCLFELNKDQIQSIELHLVAEGDRWREFLIEDSHTEYRIVETNFGHVKNIPNSIEWTSFKEKIQGVNENIRRAKTKKEIETIQPFLMSFEMALHKHELIFGKQQVPDTSRHKPETTDHDFVECKKYGRVSVKDNCTYCGLTPNQCYWERL